MHNGCGQGVVLQRVELQTVQFRKLGLSATLVPRRESIHVRRPSGITRGWRARKGELAVPHILVCHKTMSALRLVTSAARRAPRNFALGRRGYAEAADKINLSLVLPHQVRLPATTASPFLRILAGFLTESCTRLNRLFSLPRMLCK